MICIIFIYIILSAIIQRLKFEKINSLVSANFLFIIFFLFFFIESFNTYGFFLDKFGHSKVHWQTYVGPVELMLQGGYLLWDTPSQYGFLNTIFIYLMPFDDPWMKLYYLNSLLTLSFSIMLFLTIWNKGSFLWLIISFLITYSVIFLLPGGQWQFNIAATPSSGMMRFFISVILIFLVIKIHKKLWIQQIQILVPVWLIGVFWSFESAFYCSCVILPWVIHNLFLEKNTTKQKFVTLLSFPVSFLVCVILISLYYLVQIGNLPDYWAFAEYAFSFTSGHANISISTTGSFISWLLLTSILFYILKFIKYKFIFFSSILLLYSYLSYFITRGADLVIVNQLKLLFFILFINFNLINKFEYQNIIKKFSSIFVLTIIFGFCNPAYFNHIIKVVNSQDYNLSNVHMKNNDNFNYILKLISETNQPISYIENGRYLNTYFFDNDLLEYKKDNIIWLPSHPASLLQPLNNSRIEIYINRWLKRRNLNSGWLIYEIDSHWNQRIVESIKTALNKYNVKNKIKYNNMQALLFYKNDKTN